MLLFKKKLGKTKLKKISGVCHIDEKTIKCKEAFTVKAGGKWLCLGQATRREFWVAGKIFIDSGEGCSSIVLVSIVPMGKLYIYVYTHTHTLKTTKLILSQFCKSEVQVRNLETYSRDWILCYGSQG